MRVVQADGGDAVTEHPAARIGRAVEPFGIDTSVAHMARMYDYLLGGSDHFAIDREVTEQVTAFLPGGIEAARASVRANRVFLGQVVGHLIREAGVRQFLDIGTGIPNADNVHAVAQEVAPDARVVYVDYDPVVLAHAHALLRSTPEGATSYIHGDLRDPDAILDRAAMTLDLTQPVGIMVVGILHYVLDSDDPHGIVARLLEAVAPGSYLAITHIASDVQPEVMAEMAERHNDAASAEPAQFRSRAEMARFFRGLDLVEPGIVRVEQWRSESLPSPPSGQWLIPIYAAVGRKPLQPRRGEALRPRPRAASRHRGRRPHTGCGPRPPVVSAPASEPAQPPATGADQPLAGRRLMGCAGLAGLGALAQTVPDLMPSWLRWPATVLAICSAVGLVLLQARSWSFRRKTRGPT